MNAHPFTTALKRPGRTALVVLLSAVVLFLMGVAIERWAVSSAAQIAQLAANERMRANAGLFESELQKYRLLPLVLAENSDVISLVESHDPNVAKQLNGKLRFLAQHTGSEVIYVIDSSGITLSASNFDLPTSFVGQNFAFRPYFRRALIDRSAEYFARGLVSGQPGLFFAQAVSNGRGVIVVKISLDRLEAIWGHQPGITIIRDPDGIITAASIKDWVLHPSRPLSPAARQKAQKTLQFGATMPASLSFALPPPTLAGSSDQDIVVLPPNRRYAIASTSLQMDEWILSSLEPMDAALRDARLRAQVIGLVVILILVLCLGLTIRSVERRRLLVSSRRTLEREVKRQTAELRDTNQQLVAEVSEREAASRRLRTARDELAQANRLGSIGQITAGVAHEINQPVAAIRTFAENAKVLIDKSDTVETQRNLDVIIDLTSRIGDITTELRNFARRDPPPIGEINLGDALDGALILIGDRLRGEGVALVMPKELAASVMVLADRVRLEQVVINLLQNSLDALAETEDRRIEIRLETRPDRPNVRLTFDDSGPGVPAGMRTTLFEPFVTGKKQGLGLGLGIAQNIVREFGGELEMTASRFGGAAFCVTLLKP
ncbi:ATP-binding protein [Novosphingobium sp. Gsoil 351]|uniref:sensor histidine kinase n=1 Tax=Novosphingobium sp. Gsoil 351 TaxID=2675225 RepID=UPI0018A804A9|nr:ATP-binding protein [Novosphingobium sp. Gsoil 351]